MMAQLSRPYQVVLILVAVLALAWFAVLRSHVSTSSSGSSGGGASSQASAAAPKAGAIERHESTPTRVYHGPAPGVEGLTKDVRRAHEAVGASEAQTHKLESAGGSPSASSGASRGSQAASGVPSTAAAAGSRTAAKPHSSSATHPASATRHHSTSSAPSTAPKGGDASRAFTVAKQLRQGKVVLLLFWNSHSFDDQAVHSQVQAASGALKGKVAADYAKPGEVSAFGTVTRDISVLQTPTLLVINRKGLTTTITGLTDAFAIEQAVREAGG